MAPPVTLPKGPGGRCQAGGEAVQIPGFSNFSDGSPCKLSLTVTPATPHFLKKRPDDNKQLESHKISKYS